MANPQTIFTYFAICAPITCAIFSRRQVPKPRRVQLEHKEPISSQYSHEFFKGAKIYFT